MRADVKDEEADNGKDRDGVNEVLGTIEQKETVQCFSTQGVGHPNTIFTFRVRSKC